jgi:hypothetical protein
VLEISSITGTATQAGVHTKMHDNQVDDDARVTQLNQSKVQTGAIQP